MSRSRRESRRFAREQALRALYAMDLGGVGAAEALDALWGYLRNGWLDEEARPAHSEVERAREALDRLLAEVEKRLARRLEGPATLPDEAWDRRVARELLALPPAAAGREARRREARLRRAVADLRHLGAAATAEALALLLDEGPARGEVRRFVEDVARGVERRRAEIDELIERCSVNWRLGRMPVVDRNILRFATWELLEREDLPASIVINEAVELAKRYGERETRAFVNGILDRIAAETGRGGRHHAPKPR